MPEPRVSDERLAERIASVERALDEHQYLCEVGEYQLYESDCDLREARAEIARLREERDRYREALSDVLRDIGSDQDDDNNSIWQHRCSDRVGGCTAISQDVLTGMRARVAAAIAEHHAKGAQE